MTDWTLTPTQSAALECFERKRITAGSLDQYLMHRFECEHISELSDENCILAVGELMLKFCMPDKALIKDCKRTPRWLERAARFLREREEANE